MNDMDGHEEKTVGEVFSIGKDNPPIPGCTVSKAFGGDKGIIFFFPGEAYGYQRRNLSLS